LARRSARLREDVGPALDDAGALRKLIEENPIAAWAEGKGTGGMAFFSYENGVFSFALGGGEEGREDLQRMVRELVDWRLAEYLQRPPADGASGEETVCKVSHSGGRPIIFLDRVKYPHTPKGWTDVSIEGEAYRAHFVKIAINVIQRPGSEQNELPAIMRRWFGPDAGKPGTSFFVAFKRAGGKLTLTPINPAEGHARLDLWRSYSREQIPPLYKERFNAARWNTGFVTLPKHTVLLITLEKEDLGGQFQYADHFLSPDTFEMQSQNRTRQESAVGQAIKHHRERGIAIHLFVRKRKRAQGGGAAPFVYCGEVEFVSWEGERPITIRWKLSEPLPARLRELFGVEAGG
jgi:hypothetical protein